MIAEMVGMTKILYEMKDSLQSEVGSRSVGRSVGQSQGSKIVPSGCPRQLEDSPSGQVPFHSHLPNGQGIR